MRIPAAYVVGSTSLLLTILMTPAGAGAQIIVGRSCTDPGGIPQTWIDQTKAELHIAYNHTSHGSQLVTGMDAIASYPDFGNRYEWSDDGSTGLDLDDYGIPCNIPDLSQGDYIDPYGVTPWVTCTRDFLDLPANAHVNVIMWSWCSIDGHDAQRYVDNMEILVAEYPDVHFVFMTGHAQGQGEEMTPDGVHYNNQLIRAHCTANDRILLDFAEIEAYDPDGAYYWDQHLWDNLDYDGGNWAVEWINANPTAELSLLTNGDGVAGYSGCTDCSHSSSPSEANLNCVLKGRGIWWLFARLAGWPGDDNIFADGFESGDLSNWN